MLGAASAFVWHHQRMKVPESELTGGAGVAVVDLLIRQKFGWLFREQLQSDFGIDAHVEIVIDSQATGRLLAMQIKSGSSYLTEQNSVGFIYRPDPAHVEYWLTHSLPTLIVLVEPESQQAWWQKISHDKLISTGKGWKNLVPVEQQLESKWVDELQQIADDDPYILGLRQFQLAKPWMQLLQGGGTIVLEVDEWINKTSGRADIRLHGYNEDGSEVGERRWPYFILPFADYEVELPRLFPWADLKIDEDFYYDYDFEQYQLECGAYDSEEQRYILYSQDFDDWRSMRNMSELRAYEEGGEIALGLKW